MPTDTHPDSHQLDDWAIYGPKDPLIATLVARLAIRHGLRVREIEAILISALTDRLEAEEDRRSNEA